MLWTFAQWHNRNVPWPSPVAVRRPELSSAAPAGKHLNWQETYAENMARFSSYHNECVHRCDEHFWRLSEWLAGVAAAASGTDVPTRPLMMPGWNAAHGEWHADTKRCAERVATAEDSAPAGHKKHKKNGNASGDAPPPPLVLPIVHGDFNWTHDGSAKNGSRRPMEMQPSVTLVIDRSSSADQRQKVILVDTGLPANRQAVLSGYI
uniref:Endo/exonuclease/phosphatase domain-containing protein n=1 Tax=Globodera pallida TaxID=36090 RepID=A0A183BYF8_GLOPA